MHITVAVTSGSLGWDCQQHGSAAAHTPPSLAVHEAAAAKELASTNFTIAGS